MDISDWWSPSSSSAQRILEEFGAVLTEIPSGPVDYSDFEEYFTSFPLPAGEEDAKDGILQSKFE